MVGLSKLCQSVSRKYPFSRHEPSRAGASGRPELKSHFGLEGAQTLDLELLDLVPMEGIEPTLPMKETGF
jgi:hypothetical protein